MNPMNSKDTLIEELKALSEISLILNQADYMNAALNEAVAKLVALMGLETAWIFFKDDSAVDIWWGSGYKLAAHVNLPSGMALDEPEAWKKGCDCQAFCTNGKLTEAYNEVRCSRIEELNGGHRGLRIHASAPLRSGDSVMGILNVAAPDWEHFTPRSLDLLTNVGAQIGIALERARLYDLLQEKRIDEQAALLNLSSQLLARHELDDILNYLVHEVKKLLKSDASAVFLLNADTDILSFRAAAGWITDPVREHRNVPADESSASGWVVRNQKPLIYHRDHPDPEIPVWTSSWLYYEDIQSVALVPLISNEKTIGTLSVNMRQQRFFNEDDVRFLQLMANQAAVAIEQAHLQEGEILRHRMEEEMAVGRQIQLSLLPKSCPVVKDWAFCDVYQAAKQVGGDYYDFISFPANPDEMGLVIADVSDKGVPAALFMGVSRTIIRGNARAGHSPGATLILSNTQIMQESVSDYFISVFYAVLDMNSGVLTYSNAGHNPPLHYRAESGDFEELNTEGIVLGVFEEIQLGEKSTTVSTGDILVFYTDGVSEAMDEDFAEYGVDRLKAVVQTKHNLVVDDILDAITVSVDQFTGQVEQNDDFTLFLVKRM